jgi:hypothetical protein
MKNKNGYVYLMFDGTNFKIGKTNDLTKRLNQFRTSNINIKLLAYRKSLNPIYEEKYLQKTFLKYRISNEWFKINNLYDLSRLWLSFQSFDYQFKDIVSTIYDFDSEFIDKFVNDNFNELENEAELLRKKLAIYV